MPMATPNATATRKPLILMLPPETWFAFIATAIREGSAIVVLKPIKKAHTHSRFLSTRGSSASGVDLRLMDLKILKKNHFLKNLNYEKNKLDEFDFDKSKVFIDCNNSYLIEIIGININGFGYDILFYSYNDFMIEYLTLYRHSCFQQKSQET